MSSSNSRSNLVAIASVIVFALLILSGYLFYVNQNLKQTNEEMAQSINEKEQLYEELDDSYNQAVAELDEMKGNNEELNALIEKQKEELKAKKNQISSLLRTKNDLSKARKEIATIQEQLDEYITQVNQLKAENEQLMAQNQDLGNQNASLRQDLTAKTAQADELETARARLVSEKDNLTNRNADLNRKVNIASVIQVSEVTTTGWKMRKNGKEAKKKYAKNIDRLEFCFVTSENLVVESGNETFHLRVINPLGETLAVEELGSGVMLDASTNEQIRYTQTGQVEYQNESGQVCMDWSPSTPFDKGLYAVEIYNKGYLAGRGEFNLK